MTSAKSSSTFYVFELHNLDNLYCCGWVPCFLVSRPFRSRDEFLLLYGVTRCISWSDSHEVTTFLTLDNVYILVCTDCLVLSDVYIPLVVRIGCFVQINASLQVDCILHVPFNDYLIRISQRMLNSCI